MNKISLNFISSYFRGRKQRVKLQNFFSEWKITLLGVPKGSILGPLLFNIFLNDVIFFIEKCSLCNYVDDNTISAYEISGIVMKLCMIT